jgi:hypothetical protein
LKAKEYYAKYAESLQSPETMADAAWKLMQEFMDETLALGKKRNIRLDAGCDALIREQNNKWNALARMFDPPILRTDGFAEFVNGLLAAHAKRTSGREGDAR